MDNLATLEHARELVTRIEAMVLAPYWTSDRREKIGETARRAINELSTVIECLKSSTSTRGVGSGSFTVPASQSPSQSQLL